MIAPELAEILGDLASLSQIAQGTRQAGAKESTVSEVLSAVNADLALNRLTYAQVLGLASTVAALAVRVADLQANLLTAIGRPQQATLPVRLPAVPPQGYGGASAADVWSYPSNITGNSTGQDVGEAASLAEWLTSPSIAYAARSPLFHLYGRGMMIFTPFSNDLAPPDFDFSIVTPGQTLQTALNAQNPGWNWYNLPSQPQYYYAVVPSDNRFTWVCTVSEGEFAAIVAPTASYSPPIWPGASKVTLGASVALADALSVPGPLDGLIVKITAVPSPIGYYGFGARKSFVHVGGVIFITDNGEAEQSQPLGLDDEVLVPKSAVQASSAIIRLKSGVVGTVQPWTLK